MYNIMYNILTYVFFGDKSKCYTVHFIVMVQIEQLYSFVPVIISQYLKNLVNCVFFV